MCSSVPHLLCRSVHHNPDLCDLHSKRLCTSIGPTSSQSAVSDADRKPCGFSQTFNMTGQWSKSPSPSFHGFYNMTADCPQYAQDFDCQTPQKSGTFVACTEPMLPFGMIMPLLLPIPASMIRSIAQPCRGEMCCGKVVDRQSGCAGINDVSAAFIDSQYSQVFTPDDCALREFDAENFNTQMAGRRLLFLGDSLMRGNWGSLACLLRDQVSVSDLALASSIL